jgi:CRISPR/Cas system-associated exonuclease Cas4 (RecB family)
MKPYTINEKQITFLDNRFYQAENGSYIPSVTTILQAYPKDAHFYQWLKQVGEDADNIRDEAGRRGSIVHELTERYDAGEEISLITQGGNINYKLSEWAMFERYVQFREMVEPNILNSEFNIISSYYGFAGTIDRIMEINGKNYLIDIKTSNSMHEHYWLQLSAYQMLCEEYYKSTKIIDEVAILWLNAKTRTVGKNGAIQGQGWQLLIRDHAERANDWALFKATHMLWLHQNKTLIPQNKSFTLNHKL